MNTKKTSGSVATKASATLRSSSASDIAKQLAGSALSQANKGNQTSSKMEDIASKVLRSDKYSEQTKEFAGSVLSQSNKNR
jgi:hypothetical protein